MNIVVVSNPVSGAGRSAAMAKIAAEALVAAGHSVGVAPTRPGHEPIEEWLLPVMRDADLLVVAGGDGAVRLAGEAARRTGIPLYHLPCGTENLFAREFGMNCDPRTLVRAVEAGQVRSIDTGVADGETFLLMASVGYDAEVVHDLAQRRAGGVGTISHFTYLAPILAQFRRWTPPRLIVEVDGERVDDGGPGFVVVANSRQYGWRIDPAGRASMTDGQLDIVYFPARTRRDLLRWAWRCRRQRQFDDRRLVFRRGQRVSIASEGECRYQLDGDPPRRGCQGELRLNLEVRPASLRVLVPAEAPTAHRAI